MIKTLKNTTKEIYNWTKDKVVRFKNWLVILVLGAVVVAAPLVIPPNIPDIALENIQADYHASELKDKYRLEKTAFILDAIDENAIQAEVGNKNSDSFEPSLTLRKWNDEVNFKVKYKHGEKEKDQKVDIENKKIKWKGKKTEVHYYDIKKGELLHDKVLEADSFEVEVLLLEKPDTNIVSFDIETQGLSFYYQPELTQEEIDDGANRPENVIGSYAIYHESKTNNALYPIDKSKYTQEELDQMVLDGRHIGKTNDNGEIDYFKVGKKYMAGKAFHIYRPKIIDSAGKEIWGKLNITDNLLTVEIPQGFIDNAVYPVRHAAGLTIGYTSIGGNEGLWGADTIRGIYPFTASASGTIDKMSVYKGNHADYAGWWRPIIYKNSDDSLVAYGNEVVQNGTNHWQDIAFSGNLVNGTEYMVSLWLGPYLNYPDIPYDTITNIMARDAHIYHATNAPPDPCDWDAGKPWGSSKFSVYCTYTAAAEERRIIIIE